MNIAHIDRGTVTCTTCNPFDYEHVCGNRIEIPKFEQYPDDSFGCTAECTCGKTIDFFVIGRKVRVLERCMSREQMERAFAV